MYRTLVFLAPLWMLAQSTDVPVGVRLTPPGNVPATVIDRFRIDFPKASPAWEQRADEWTATFSDDSTHLPRVAVYDKAGTLVEGRKQLEKGGYPERIDHYFHSHYPTDPYAVWRHDGRDAQTHWFAIRNTDTTWFRQDGSYAYNLNVRRAEPLATGKDAEVIRSLWDLNQMRLSILKVAAGNGFITTTRQQQAEQMDTALRKLAFSRHIPLSYSQDEKDHARIHALSKLNGDQLTRSVNRELYKTSAQIGRLLERAGRSKDEEIKSLAREFGGPR